MSALYLLVPLALLQVLVGIAIWIWAVDKGQFDGLDQDDEFSPARRILSDDDPMIPRTDGSRKA